MFVYRAKVIEMTQSGTCKVKIYAATGNSEIEASICTQKGFYSYYKTDEVVYVAWLGENEWVILGCPNPGLDAEIDSINTVKLFAKNGILYGDILISQKTPGIDNPVEDKKVKIKDLVSAYTEVSTLREKVSTLQSSVEDIKKILAILEQPEVPSDIKVTGVTLNKEQIELEVGQSETLIASVLPTDATNKNVTWESSNQSVATVQDGVVTAIINDDDAIITVKTIDGEYTATCIVTVKEALEEPGSESDTSS